MRNSAQEARSFIKQQLSVGNENLTRDFETRIIDQTMRRFGLSEETIVGLLREAMVEVKFPS